MQIEISPLMSIPHPVGLRSVSALLKKHFHFFPSSGPLPQSPMSVHFSEFRTLRAPNITSEFCFWRFVSRRQKGLEPTLTSP